MKNLATSASCRSYQGAFKPVIGLSLIAILALSACSMRSITDGASSLTGPFADRINSPDPIPDANGIIERGNIRYIIARSGDDMASIASRAGVSTAQLASYNGLPEGYMPREGEELAVPKIVPPQPPAGFGENVDGDINANGLDPNAVRPDNHTVVAGETIFEVARLYNIPVSELARANGLGSDLTIKPGQVLTIPKQTASLSQSNTADDSSTQSSQSESSSSSQSTSPSGFVKPVAGSITEGYDPGADRDGYVYSTSSQAPVKSVGEGKVVLVSESTGDQGTVVMIQHPNGLISIYGQMSNLKVTKGDSVTKGQSIGTTDSDKLMFQIRRGTAPVNPGEYI